jgi:hypothetical protein
MSYRDGELCAVLSPARSGDGSAWQPPARSRELKNLDENLRAERSRPVKRNLHSG